ncbi:MAG: citramalate synthase [Phycisphaeraceae bacterium]
MTRRIEIYDTTLRDGTQGEGVAFSLVDKLKITRKLDSVGVDFIEGGYPLSNPKDAAYFEEAAKLKLSHAKVCAFGMTRRKGIKAADDPGMKALVASKAAVVTIVGKTWDLHVDEVLRVDRQENLEMIRDSVAFVKASGPDVFYDAEHFFDGYRANPEYAVATLRAALEGGATRLVLCDTNGGSLPAWITKALNELIREFGLGGWGGVRDAPADGPDAGGRAGASQSLSARHPSYPDFVGFGIHVHNDGGLAVANSLAAVEAGAVQVQGTINGIGERCGNVDLINIVASLRLKLELDCLKADAMMRLTDVSRYIYELANMNPISNQPYVGASAFAHKGGMHVHAVQRIAHSYEHVKPESVGNTRRVLVSELSGVSNIVATLGVKFGISDNREVQKKLLDRVNDLEMQGYQFEVATASFELLLHDILGTLPRLWALDHYRCVIYRNGDDAAVTEATVKVLVNGAVEHQVAEGDGPVNALDGALRKCLVPHYPQLAELHLRDFRVRVVNPRAESAAKVRVIAEFATLPRELGEREAASGEDGGANEAVESFATIGVNENIVDASWKAITDAFTYHLIEAGVGGDSPSGSAPQPVQRPQQQQVLQGQQQQQQQK